ncbi:MAG: RIP metalloprotease RseP [Hoylesella marshii]|uniref:RIP metalloprotease RseP n=1 Tax=Hoylesella marshii TaxID=189722 RepID=UPI003FA07414
MEVFFIRLLQFMLAISLLVLLHEGGHFFFARLFKVRVEKFYLFFDPWFHLFEFKPKNSDTRYGLGWLPFGGYCKISGMIDESMDTEQMKQPVQPWEFRSKPAWQRLLIMLGGVVVNFLLALFIYSMVLFYWGDSYVRVADMKMGMTFNEEAKTMGFRDGDVLIGTDKKTFKDFNADLFRDISEARRVDVVRNGKSLSIPLSGDINLLDMIKHVPPFVRPLIPAEVDSVFHDSPAEKIGLRKGDRLLAINGKNVNSWSAFTDEIGRLSDAMTAVQNRSDSLKLRTVTVVYKHRADNSIDTVRTILTPELQLGVKQTTLYTYYEPIHVSYGFFESFPAGIAYGVHTLKGYVGDMKYLFSSDGAKSLGGFGAIGSMFPPVWDWMIFWRMTAFLSIILAFMNILPIPALDGGHVLFLLYEMITRRKPSENFMVKAEYIGISLLLLLMVVANLNDILRWLGYI